MEKSWENFWTTGKVEDYLTYRNRVTTSESEKQERSTDIDKWRGGSTTEKENSSWKGFT
ncbi:MAG: hypothetical protein J6J73_01745 [Agathobacter sp.]|nr:hypothetical protein [Agathobacter sp.]